MLVTKWHIIWSCLQNSKSQSYESPASLILSYWFNCLINLNYFYLVIILYPLYYKSDGVKTGDKLKWKKEFALILEKLTLNNGEYFTYG